MKKLVEETKLNYDVDDNRLFVEEMYFVDASKMSEEVYNKMEEEVNNTSIKTKYYDVYAWNDCSGYEYWKKGSKEGDHNYIQVTVSVKDPSKAKAAQIDKHVTKVMSKLYHWHCYK